VTIPGLQGWRIAPARELNGAVRQVKTGALINQDGDRLMIMQIDDGDIVTLGPQAMVEHITHCRAEKDLKDSHDRRREHGGSR
jgi:hypothetical protein